ncbi:MAG: hypothetical protein AAGB18_01275 [Pseudomonadota bacterium]
MHHRLAYVLATLTVGTLPLHISAQTGPGLIDPAVLVAPTEILAPSGAPVHQDETNGANTELLPAAGLGQARARAQDADLSRTMFLSVGWDSAAPQNIALFRTGLRSPAHSQLWVDNMIAETLLGPITPVAHRAPMSLPHRSVVTAHFGGGDSGTAGPWERGKRAVGPSLSGRLRDLVGRATSPIGASLWARDVPQSSDTSLVVSTRAPSRRPSLGIALTPRLDLSGTYRIARYDFYGGTTDRAVDLGLAYQLDRGLRGILGYNSRHRAADPVPGWKDPSNATGRSAWVAGLAFQF